MSKSDRPTLDYRNSHKSSQKGANYDESFYKSNYKNLILRWEEKILKNILVDQKITSYIDFACGTGRITRIIEPNVKESLGIDVSESMLEIARSKSTKSKFLRADITREKEVSDPVDLITAFRFFTNAQPSLRNDAILAIDNVLKPGGLFIFNLHMNSASPYALLARAYELFTGKRKGFNHLSLKRFKSEYLNQLGFEVVEIHALGIIPVIREEKVYSKGILTLIERVEKLLSYIPGASKISKYQILVCKKNDA